MHLVHVQCTYMYVSHTQAKKFSCEFSEAFLEVHYAPFGQPFKPHLENVQIGGTVRPVFLLLTFRVESHTQNIFAKTYFSVFFLLLGAHCVWKSIFCSNLNSFRKCEIKVKILKHKTVDVLYC